MKDLVAGKKRIHFIGVAGIGMSALAKALQASGYRISGSDIKEGVMVQELRRRGIDVFVGHHEGHVQGAEMVVYSSAIHPDNPELVYARLHGIPTAHRAELLAHFMNQGQSIAILGTHGKTTTTSLVSHLLTRLGLHPTCFVGGEMTDCGDNVLLGERNWTVGEVDESDGTHLFFSPSHVILTNLEEDHLDHYSGLADIKARFRKFLENLRPESTVVCSADCPNLQEVVSGIGQRVVTYGLPASSDFSASEIEFRELSSQYQLMHCGVKVGTVHLSIPGEHNVRNSLGVIALLSGLGFSLDAILTYLPECQAPRRRLELKWNRPGLMVIDDYAHHPTEVQASLSALKPLGRRVTCIFQPHRYSRTHSLGHTFAHSFAHADRLILTEIYGAGETNTAGVDSGLIYEAVSRAGHPSILRIPKDQVIDYLLSHLSSNEVVAFLGAGDITEVADRFVEGLKHRNSPLQEAG